MDTVKQQDGVAVRVRVWGATDHDAEHAASVATYGRWRASWWVTGIERVTGVPCPLDTRDPAAIAADAAFGWAYVVHSGAAVYRVEGDGHPYYLTRAAAESRIADLRAADTPGVRGDLTSGFEYTLLDRVTDRPRGTARVVPASMDEIERDAQSASESSAVPREPDSVVNARG